MHKVTLCQLMSAMDSKITLAHSYSGVTEKGKRLAFVPSELRYYITYSEGQLETSDSYLDVLTAIEKYNEIDA